MDTTAYVWTIPATRMKANREHRVPLCRRAVEILDASRTFGDDGGRLVFTVGDGEPLEEKVLRRLLERRRVPAVPHGFRSSFRDWAAEETEHRREVIEAALAHVVGNKVEAAYARSDLFERRRRLMDDWAQYVAGAVPQHGPRSGREYRSTRAIASGTNLPEARVREICSIHPKIHLSTGEKPDKWRLN